MTRPTTLTVVTPEIFTYTPIHKPNQVVTGTGRVCVVTGWLPKDSIKSRTNKSKYAAIGNLYSSSRGIGFLIRNLLANNHVRFIVIIESTKQDKNSGSSRCLFDFFSNGVTKQSDINGRECWKINSDVAGFIDIGVHSDSLDYIREHVKCVLVNSVEEAVSAINYFSEIEIVDAPKPLPINIDAPLPQVDSVVKPNQLCGHIVKGKTIAETWVKIIQRIRTSGVIRPHGHDGEWQELIDLVSIVTDEPEEFYFPEPNYLPVNREFLADYIPQVLQDSPYVEGVKYTYGQRMRSWFERDQIEQVIQKLVVEIDAASAVINLWDVKDHEKGGSPCLNHIWFRVNQIDGVYRMSMTATFRSNDMFGAWVSNAMALRALQRHVANEVSVRLGTVIECAELITISQSAHIYDDCWENSGHLIENEYAKIVRNLDYYDSVGNFIVEIEGDEKKTIVVTHTHPDNSSTIGTYSGTNPLKILRDICSDMPSIQPTHAGYLGIELSRASNCIKNSLPYIQDC